MLKSYLDRTLVPGEGGAWDLPKDGSGTLVPRLTNVKRVVGISTYGAPQHLVLLAGDNGRNTISTAIRPLFHEECTCLWLGLYNIDATSTAMRDEFCDKVRACIREMNF